MSKENLYRLSRDIRFTPVFEVVRLAQECGHAVVFTPPYHCEYNPIELVWGIAKRHFDSHIDGVGAMYPGLTRKEQVIALWHESLASVTPSMWKNCVRKVITRIRQDYHDQIGKFGELTAPQPIVIPLGIDEEDDDDENEDIDDPPLKVSTVFQILTSDVIHWILKYLLQFFFF